MARKRSAKERRRRQRKTQQAEARKKRILIAGLVALAVVVLGALSVYRNATAPQVSALEDVHPANVDGPAGAPVQIVEFGDFGCPSCRAWHNAGVKEQLQAAFGDQINFTFRHFPVITRQSPKAAEAAQCAAEQDAFWAYHDYLYETAPAGALDVTSLKQYAAALGLNAEQFNQCLDSGKYQSYVARDARAAEAAGARGTPSFYVNGTPAGFSFQQMAGMVEQILDEG